VRSGDVRPLAAVVEHNRLDIVAVALLTARAAQLLESGAGEALTAREALGLGRLYARAGRLSEAQASFARAASMAEPDEIHTAAEAWHAYAVSLRRERRYEEAAAAWGRILDLHSCPQRLALAASEALAVHHEHRDRNLRRAHDFAWWSLQLTATPGRVHAARHRLARLDRKLARTDSKAFDIRTDSLATLF
jgi:tetratricopeptide (TPR) repeat protein